MTTATVSTTRKQTGLWSWAFFRSPWQYFLTALALIGLVDVTKQLVEWAALIHWLAENYAAWRTWLFSWSPIHFPPEWHNYIVLGCVTFSITNIGYYRRTGTTFLIDALVRSPIFGIRLLISLLRGGSKETNFPEWLNAEGTRLDEIAIMTTLFANIVLAIFIFIMGAEFVYKISVALWRHEAIYNATYYAFHETFWGGGWIPYFDSWPVWHWVRWCFWSVLFIACTGVLIAWRWILGTGFLFAALVAGNEIYINWLAPVASGVLPG